MIYGIHPCGHTQIYCPRCTHTGCDNTNCQYCIGDGNTAQCKICTNNQILTMNQYQSNKQAEAQKIEYAEKALQTRLKALEQATHVSYDSASNSSYSGRRLQTQSSLLSKMFALSFIAIICHFIANGLNGSYTGFMKIIVALINILGYFGGILLKILEALASNFV